MNAEISSAVEMPASSNPKLQTSTPRDHDRVMSTGTTDKALCAGQTDLWFATDPVSITQAIAICAICPERQPCLERAEACGEQYGVWGGKLFPDGRIPRPVGRPSKGRTGTVCRVIDIKSGMRIRVAEDRKAVSWTVEAVTGDDRSVRLSLRCGETCTQLVRAPQSRVDIDPSVAPMPPSTLSHPVC